MTKLAITIALIIAAAGIVLAVTVPGVTDGFRYFIAAAGMIVALFTAAAIAESNPAR